MKKILILKGYSLYNVLRYWTDALAIGFEKQGVEVTVLDLKILDDHILGRYLDNEYDAVLAFNGYMIETGISSILKCPYIFLLIDHPIDHINRINNLESKDIITIIDRNDINTINRLCKPPSFVYMLPHAAQEVSFHKYDKSIDILFSGTFMDPEEIKDSWKGNEILFTIFEDVVNNCLYNTELYYIEEVEIWLERKYNTKVDLKENNFNALITDIGRYIYAKRRLNVLESILNAGIEVHIYGDKWQDSPLIRYENVSLHESVNYWQLQEVMKQSKIILNITGIANDGTHERVFAAMAAKSVLVSNRTPYLSELFKEDEELIFFNFDHIERVPEKLRNLLGNEDEINRISQNAVQAITGKHTWSERAKQIIEIFQDATSQIN